MKRKVVSLLLASAMTAGMVSMAFADEATTDLSELTIWRRMED